MANIVSASDIAKAVQICYRLCNRCFARHNQADVRYSGFLADVNCLAAALRDLEEAYQRVEADHRRNNSLHQLHSNAKQTWDRPGVGLAGDFLKTIRDCEKFLVQNERFVATNSKVLRSAEWYIRGMEAQMQVLRDRIKFHCLKIPVILKPLEMALQRSDSNRLARIEQRLQEYTQTQNGTAVTVYSLPPIPLALADHYERAALLGTTSIDPNNYPLIDTFDALLYHYNQSTILASADRVLDPNRCNAILKTRWILKKLLDLPAFQDLASCITRSIVSCIETELKLEQASLHYGWESEQCDQILLLNGDWAKVWCRETSEPVSSTDVLEIAGEVGILDETVQAGSDGSSQRILLFQQPRSNTEFRLLETAHDRPILEVNLDTSAERLVPIYALPDFSLPQKQVVHIYQKRFGNPNIFEFRDRAAALRMQQALTNQNVVHDGDVLQWTITRNNSWRRGLKGTAKSSAIQLWYPKTSMPYSLPGGDNAFDLASCELTRNILSSCLPTSHDPSPLIIQAQRDDGKAAIGIPPERPALILFTRLLSSRGMDTLGYIFVPLKRGIDINTKRCGCALPDSECTDVVLEMKPGKRENFMAKIHRAFETRDWNLFSFCNPKPAEYHKLDSINNICELNLRFANVQQRKLFQYNLLRVTNLHKEALESFRLQNMAMRARANQASDRQSLYSSRLKSKSCQSPTPPSCSTET